MKKTYISILLFLSIIFVSGMVQAASVSLTASPSQVTVGNEFTVSANLTGASIASLSLKIGVDTSKVDYVSGPASSSFRNGTAIYTWTDPQGGLAPLTGGTIVTFKFRAKSEGTANFSVSGSFYDANEQAVTPGFAGTSISINPVPTAAPVQPTVNPTPVPTVSTPTNAPVVTEAPNNNSQQNPAPTQNTGNNYQGTVSSNANLKEMRIDVEGITPKFSKNITSYNVVVSNDVNNINVVAVPEDNSASVTVTGNNNLIEGSNIITISVTAPDGKTKKNYIINVTKTANPELANASLENLAIENVTLNPEFNSEIMNYTAEVEKEVENLNILAVPQRENATVTVNGGQNLTFGENVINITVLAEDGLTEKIYTVVVNRKGEEQQTEAIIDENNDNNEQKQTNIIGKIVGIIVVLGIAGGIGYFLFSKYPVKKK